MKDPNNTKTLGKGKTAGMCAAATLSFGILGAAIGSQVGASDGLVGCRELPQVWTASTEVFIDDTNATIEFFWVNDSLSESEKEASGKPQPKPSQETTGLSAKIDLNERGCGEDLDRFLADVVERGHNTKNVDCGALHYAAGLASEQNGGARTGVVPIDWSDYDIVSERGEEPIEMPSSIDLDLAAEVLRGDCSD